MNVTEIESKATNPKPEPFTARYGEVPLSAILGRVIRNPAYGGEGVGIYGWVGNACVSACRKPQFMAALEESVRNEGFRNPVILYSTPTGLWLAFGGSRVIAGRRAGLETIPAIINDYTGEYEDFPEVNEANFNNWFTDPPKWHEFGERGVDYHYSIERNRRHEYDEAGMNWVSDEAEWISQEFPWL